MSVSKGVMFSSANVRTNSLYNQCPYPKVSCPHQYLSLKRVIFLRFSDLKFDDRLTNVMHVKSIYEEISFLHILLGQMIRQIKQRHICS